MDAWKIKDGRELRIAVSGKSGCGNTTVSGLLAKTLGIKLINFTFRQLAEEKGMTLAQVIEAAKTDDSYDKTVDTRQVELAKKESCVLGSRLAIWMLKEADVKIYLLASDELRAKRILKREGGDLSEITAFTSTAFSTGVKEISRMPGRISVSPTPRLVFFVMTMVSCA